MKWLREDRSALVDAIRIGAYDSDLQGLVMAAVSTGAPPLVIGAVTDRIRWLAPPV